MYNNEVQYGEYSVDVRQLTDEIIKWHESLDDDPWDEIVASTLDGVIDIINEFAEKN